MNNPMTRRPPNLLHIAAFIGALAFVGVCVVKAGGQDRPENENGRNLSAHMSRNTQ